MQTNGFGQSYVGNDDFRGWLNAKARGGDLSASQLLNFVGNDGKSGNEAFNNMQGSWSQGPLKTYGMNGAQLADYYYNEWLSGRNTPAQNNSASYVVSGSGSGLSAEQEATNRRMRDIYDRQIGDINDNLGGLSGRLNNTLAGLQNQYNTYRNEQQDQYNQAKNSYDQSTLRNRQDLVGNRNDIDKRTALALRSMQRTLGAMGAGGSSAAMYDLPSLIMAQANSENSNASRTYSQNQQNLDTNWGNYQSDFENDKKKLNDWYDSEVKSAKQSNYEEGQNLLNQLVEAYGNRAQYGGDFGNNVNDAYNRIQDFRNRINELGNVTKTQYNGTRAAYKAPELSSYDTGNTDLSTTVTESNAGSESPLLTALRGINKRRNNSPYSNYAGA